MFQIKQPPSIIIGNNSCKNFKFKNNCLVITSSGSKNRVWLDHLEISNYHLFDKVEPNPSIETVTKIITEYKKKIQK
jgi:succinate semialdehyde reductase